MPEYCPLVWQLAQATPVCAPVEREAGAAVIKGGIPPARWVVAGTAVRAKAAAMSVVALVAGGAVLRRAGIAVGMAGLAFDLGVLALQGEAGLAVVEGGIPPAGRIVAGGAFQPKLPVVGVVGAVAGDTLRGRAIKLPIGMALGAGHLGVPALQGKSLSGCDRKWHLPNWRGCGSSRSPSRTARCERRRLRWQATQVWGVPLNCPLVWHWVQVTVACLPCRAKAVRLWSKVASPQSDGLWQLPQSVPNCPLWASSLRWQAAQSVGVPSN